MGRIQFLLVGLKPFPYLKLIEVHGFIASNTFKSMQFFIFPKVAVLLDQVTAITSLRRRKKKGRGEPPAREHSNEKIMLLLISIYK